MQKDGDGAAGLKFEECKSGKNTIKISVVCFSEKTTMFLQKINENIYVENKNTINWSCPSVICVQNIEKKLVKLCIFTVLSVQLKEFRRILH